MRNTAYMCRMIDWISYVFSSDLALRVWEPTLWATHRAMTVAHRVSSYKKNRCFAFVGAHPVGDTPRDDGRSQGELLQKNRCFAFVGAHKNKGPEGPLR